jgi:hypothetical protein
MTIIMVMTVLTDWFLWSNLSVYYAVRMLSVLIIQDNLLTTSTPGRRAEFQAANDKQNVYK